VRQDLGPDGRREVHRLGVQLCQEGINASGGGLEISSGDGPVQIVTRDSLPQPLNDARPVPLLSLCVGFVLTHFWPLRDALISFSSLTPDYPLEALEWRETAISRLFLIR
jgi:hypothetical protein